MTDVSEPVTIPYRAVSVLETGQKRQSKLWYVAGFNGVLSKD
ncbi:hypothetical protein [Actinoplanes derwentensis]|nr:hypothetical protein [Actinoplanes derwentensis]